MDIQPWVLKLHRWAGLASAAFLVVVSLTGSALVYAPAIDRAAEPMVRRVQPAGAKRSPAAVLAAVAARYPDDPPMYLRRLGDGEPDQVTLRSWRLAHVDPYRATVIGDRNRNRSLVGLVGAAHGSLIAGPVGHTLVGIAGLVALFEAVTGLIRWWRYRTVAVRAGGSFRRLVFELHNSSGVLALAIVVPLTVTGVMLSFQRQIDRRLQRLDRAAVSAEAPRRDAPVGERAAPDTGTPAVASINADAAIGAALVARAGTFASLQVPSREGEAWTVWVRTPADHSPMGRARIRVERDGRVSQVRDGGPGQPGTRIQYWRDGVHGGWILGGPGEFVAFLGGLALAFQAVTGVLVWWKPR